jgi:putative copper resistance protein D
VNVGLLVHHWQLSWSLLLPALFAAGLYVAGARGAGSWPLRRTLSFLAGIAVVVVALGSGIAGYDERLLSVHMVQHMLLLLAAPLLLLYASPVLLALRALPRSGRRRLARTLPRLRRLTGPITCLGIFSAVVLATHVPAFYDATLHHPALHEAEHLTYLLAGALMWWPLLDADPARSRRLGGIGRLIYLLATMPSMALVGAYLNRAPALVYPAYGPPARALHVSALVDQAQAGAIMWVAGTMVVLAAGLWSAIAAMVAEERRLQARESGVLT